MKIFDVCGNSRTISPCKFEPHSSAIKDKANELLAWFLCYARDISFANIKLKFTGYLFFLTHRNIEANYMSLRRNINYVTKEIH
jgi:hypothetical protein